MYHSIIIGGGGSTSTGKNTWTDWHLIPTSKPYVVLPTVNEKSVEVPGRNGVIDLTTFLTGYPTYGNRKGTWEFYISNEFFLYSDPKFIRNVTNWADWPTALRTIASYCHGKVLTIILEDDPNYYYEGRLKVSYRPQNNYSIVVIDYDLYPGKTKISNGAITYD